MREELARGIHGQGCFDEQVLRLVQEAEICHLVRGRHCGGVHLRVHGEVLRIHEVLIMAVSREALDIGAQTPAEKKRARKLTENKHNKEFKKVVCFVADAPW